ncbi:MAG: ORF6N domain-containing protein [Candidatus Margulisbacteria bacterium]|nr:ORF6N domain-containing protein [Candidatus Margulisiibacteriota bacterium]
MNKLVPIGRIENRIYTIRGQKVMLDRDLAELYGVKTFVLNQAVKRNRERFPEDFMFSLTRQEILNISQIVICSPMGEVDKIKHARNVNVFTEQGLAMLSGVLHSPRAVRVNITIMRAFVRLRQILASNKDLSYLFKELKHKVDRHDTEIGLIIKTIEKMISYEGKPKPKIGFTVHKL